MNDVDRDMCANLEMKLDEVNKALHPETDPDSFEIGGVTYKMATLFRKDEREFNRLARQIEIKEWELNETIGKQMADAYMLKDPNSINISKALKAGDNNAIEDLIDDLIVECIFVICKAQKPDLSKVSFEAVAPNIAILRDIYDHQAKKQVVVFELGKSLTGRLERTSKVVGIDLNSFIPKPPSTQSQLLSSEQPIGSRGTPPPSPSGSSTGVSATST